MISFATNPSLNPFPKEMALNNLLGIIHGKFIINVE
jgi:hypothetical protein